KIVPGQNRINDLRDYGVVVTYDPGENRPWPAQLYHQIVAQLVLNASRTQTIIGEGTAAELAQCPRKTHDRKPPKRTTLTSIIRHDLNRHFCHCRQPIHSTWKNTKLP